MAEWIRETVYKIRDITDREILIRLHPALSEKGRTMLFGDLAPLFLSNVPNIKFSKSTLADDLNKSGICISYTSGSSIDAVLDGVPCIATDEGNFTWPITSHSVDEINHPYLANNEQMQQWLHNLSYCQWSKEEIKSGRVWKHLSGVINKL
jgi:hypothetical protein